MLRKIFFIILTVTLLFAISINAKQKVTKEIDLDVYPADIQKIINRGKLIIAITKDDQPPFFYVNKKGELDGLDIELAKGIAKEFNVEVEFNREATSFNGVVDMVIQGKADIALSKLSRTLTRAKKVLYTNPYIVFYHGMLLNRLKLAEATKNKTVYQLFKNFSGTIGVIARSSYVNYAKRNFPKAKIIEFPKWNPDIIQAVLKGFVLAAYRDEMEVKKIIKGMPSASLKLKTVILKDKEDAIAMAVSKDSHHLVRWLNLYLKTVHIKLNAEKLLNMYPDIFEVK